MVKINFIITQDARNFQEKNVKKGKKSFAREGIIRVRYIRPKPAQMSGFPIAGVEYCSLVHIRGQRIPKSTQDGLFGAENSDLGRNSRKKAGRLGCFVNIGNVANMGNFVGRVR